MLLRLSGPGLRPLSETSSSPFVGRLCERLDFPAPARSREILRVRRPTDVLPRGFRAYLLDYDAPVPDLRDAYRLASDQQFLTDGDIVRIDPARRSLRALYRRSSPSNFFLVTERCDNFCVMCSQPPKA